MATTSIWPVKGYLGKVVLYVENPAKTENPRFYQSDNILSNNLASLSDVIEYAENGQKTVGTDKERYITEINCIPGSARESMMETKKKFDKEDGIIAYHGYQSFAEGEVTAELAHEIGVKLAERLWGMEYEVIIATHLDKENHIHNHFVVNSISLYGKRMWSKKEIYYKMRDASDVLCREYGLSVIEKPKPGKAKHYSEWKADKEGKETWRNIIKSDIDQAIGEARSDKQFVSILESKGYELKFGKYLSVKPPGKERFFRLERNLGEKYSISNIKSRILAENASPYSLRVKKRAHISNDLRRKIKLHKVRKLSGLYCLYIHYQYLLGAIPKVRPPNNKREHFLLKEDFRKIKNINAESKLLRDYKIKTLEQLYSYKDHLENRINELSEVRRELRNVLKSPTENLDISKVKMEIKLFSKEIKKFRDRLRLCEQIEKRSLEIKGKIKIINQAQDTGKEKKNERYER